MKNDNYLVIQGWMRNELKLKGNELMVYALIYGFSQDEESEFNGSIGYIADWIGSTKQTVHNVLKSLCDKKLLHKKENYMNGVKFCSYSAILPVVKKIDGGVVKNFDGGSQKIRPNNIDNNTNTNIYSDVPDEIKAVFMEWVAMRKSIKKPVTTKQTVTRALNKLYELSQDPVEQVKLIELAIDKCWLGFYPMKQEKPVKTANFIPEPPKYREFEPEPEIETSQMPESMREKYRGFINEL